MVFSSLLFLFLFLPTVIVLYMIAPKKAKNLVLFFMSLIFYAWGEPVYVTLMLFSTVVDFINGRLVDESLKEGKKRKAQIILGIDVVINLSLLGFFKYSGLDLPLPIGISFYTFQTMSYTIDIYRREAKVQKSIIDFGTYVTLFPQLIAGPIVRYQTVAEELNHRKNNPNMVAEGIQRFLIGLGKKVLLANQIGILWDQYGGKIGGELSTLGAWIGISAFAFQIYFDFSGYSDMAIGLGKMFGFHFLENFDYPYEAVSMTDFWRRWHISLGTWFKEYVYIPLGGNKHGVRKQIRNIAIVWLLTGIWHGASLNFMYWGIYFGTLLILEKMIYGKYLEKLPKIFGHLYGILFVWIGWAIFALEDENKIWILLKQMFGFGKQAFVTNQDVYQLFSYGILFIILILACTHYPKKCWLWIKAKIGEDSIGVFVIEQLFFLMIFFCSVAYLVEATYNPFLYFRF